MTLSIDWLREVLTVPVLTMARLAACLVVAPFFSNQFITGTVRNGIILSLTLVVYPMVSPAFAAQVPSLPQAAIILVKEVFLGIVIGFLSGAPFWIASSVGFIVDTQRGTGMGEIFDPNLGTQTSPLGAMLSQVIVTLFYVSGGLFLFLGMMFEGYRLMPIESFFPRFIPVFSRVFPCVRGSIDAPDRDPRGADGDLHVPRGFQPRSGEPVRAFIECFLPVHADQERPVTSRPGPLHGNVRNFSQ